MGLVEAMVAVTVPVGDIVDVAMPLRLVATSMVTGVVAGIMEVDPIVRPGTVAEMAMPTVAHNFWANVKAPESLISDCAWKARTVCQTNLLGLRHHIVSRCKFSGY